jgi:hypothetical protein
VSFAQHFRIDATPPPPKEKAIVFGGIHRASHVKMGFRFQSWLSHENLVPNAKCLWKNPFSSSFLFFSLVLTSVCGPLAVFVWWLSNFVYVVVNRTICWARWKKFRHDKCQVPNFAQWLLLCLGCRPQNFWGLALVMPQSSFLALSVDFLAFG